MIRHSYRVLGAFRPSKTLSYPEANILNTGTLPPANPRERTKVKSEDVAEYGAKLDVGKEDTRRLPAGRMDSLVKDEKTKNSVLGSSKELAQNIREYKSHENQKIISSLMATKSADAVQYRKHRHPWELLVKPRRHRVTDMIGVLLDEHRIEMEQVIWRICDLCRVDFYFVLVPTVGYVKPRVFTESLFTQWEVGTCLQKFVDDITGEKPEGDSERVKPSTKSIFSRKKNYKRSLAKGGNGVLLLLAQQEAMVELVSSYAIAKYFNEALIKLTVKEILQPLISTGKDPSYATLQMIYALARHTDEFKDIWKPYLYPLITLRHKNELLFMQHTIYFGFYQKKPVFALTFLFVLITLWALHKIQELRCENCGVMMKRMVLPQSYYDEIEKVPELHEVGQRQERRQKFLDNLFSIYGDALTEGQRIEMRNECAEYKVFYCTKCESKKAILLNRQYHNYNNCIQCDKCRYHTVSEQKEILRLPTKTEDGVKQFHYNCQNCEWENKIYLPLLHPMELHPKSWYDVLLQRSANPNAKSEIKTF